MKEQLAKMTIIELVRTAHSYSTSIKQTGVYSELVREMASRLEALNLAHIGAMAALETTAKRIASLEARTLTVKFDPIPMGDLGNKSDGAKHPYMFGAGYNSATVHCGSELQRSCRAAGIKLQLEGE